MAKITIHEPLEPGDYEITPVVEPTPTPEPDPTPEPEPEPDPTWTMASSVSHDGFTWTFDKLYRVGRYVTGDPWVVGPVNVVAISPGWDGEKHGSEVNPVYGSDFGFDQRKFYDTMKRFAAPRMLEPGGSLVSTESYDGASSRPLLKRGAVLTCVSEAPPKNSFRPPYAGNVKMKYLADTAFVANVASLPQYDYPSLDIDALIEKHSHAVGPSLRHDWQKRWHQFGDWHEDYSRDLCSDYGAAACQLLLNIDPEKKRRLAIALTQVGIDYWGMWMSGIEEGYANGFGWNNKGQLFSWDGGIGSGRKFPIVLAGHLLGSVTLRGFYKISTHPNKGNWFHEDRQVWINDGSTGDQAWYQQNGMPGGHVAWRENNVVDPPGNTAYWTCCTANSWVPQYLVLKELGLEDAWAHPPFFDYVPWYVEHGRAQGWQEWKIIDSPWTRGFWDAHTLP